MGPITFISFEEKKKLLNNIDSVNELALFSIKDIANIVGRDVSSRKKWDGNENLRLAKVAAYYCDLLNIRIIKYSEPEYPQLLLQTHNPPLVLFARGDVSILNKKAVSVVGTRKITPTGKLAAQNFAKDAVLDGTNVVSGLAYGVDTWAHKGAVQVWEEALDSEFSGDCNKIDVNSIGKTIAILPGAIDEVVPGGNKRLATQILQSGGCILSEYGPKVPMEKWHFVARDRLIAGFTAATIVIEAPAGSGALITADFALDFNRDVVFHQAAFEQSAKQISDSVKEELKAGIAEGKVSRYKIENTPEKFLDAGAPVIKNYQDFCVYLTEPPGKRSNPIQGELF